MRLKIEGDNLKVYDIREGRFTIFILLVLFLLCSTVFASFSVFSVCSKFEGAIYLWLLAGWLIWLIPAHVISLYCSRFILGREAGKTIPFIWAIIFSAFYFLSSYIVKS